LQTRVRTAAADRTARRAAALAACLLALGLAACGSVPSVAPASPGTLAGVPAQWQAPLPHGGDVGGLARWWQRLGDPVLVELVEAAQAASPSLASARSRLLQARAAASGARAANLPSLDASASAQRGVNATSPTPGTALQAGLGASWEMDIFGGNQLAAQAADARVQGAQAQWHEARVSMAAEVALQYFGWHTCQQQLAVARADAVSRQTSARMADLSASAGFLAGASAALSRAAAAEGQARAAEQQVQCDSDRQALRALTGLADQELMQKLLRAPTNIGLDAIFSVATLPAAVLTQRPDLYAAEREVAAASLDLGAAQAQRYPRLTLAGSIGALSFSNAAGTADLTTWSVGPVALSLPLADGGRRLAQADAARARYDEAAAVYRGKARQAVREVEVALLALAGTAERRSNARTAQGGYATALQAAEARYRAGSASLGDLEDARRLVLAAQASTLQLEFERCNAWISLYRALGGGWTPADAPANTETP
jgi:NodT family efflux transporter outer membrane factor (OMF) lipoprotein